MSRTREAERGGRCSNPSAAPKVGECGPQIELPNGRRRCTMLLVPGLGFVIACFGRVHDATLARLTPPRLQRRLRSGPAPPAGGGVAISGREANNRAGGAVHGKAEGLRATNETGTAACVLSPAAFAPSRGAFHGISVPCIQCHSFSVVHVVSCHACIRCRPLMRKH